MTPVAKRICLLFASVCLIAACDQTSERVDRAKRLSEAVGDQIAGELGTEDVSGGNLERAALSDRALGGRVMTEDEAYRPPAQSRFALGAIITKPREIVAAQAQAVATDEVDASTPGARSLEGAGPGALRERLKTVIEGRDGTGELPAIPRRALARSVPDDVERRVKTNMADAMARFGLAGEIVQGTNGEMIVQLGIGEGSDVFAPQAAGQALERSALLPRPMPRFADAVLDGCPDNPTPQQIRENPALATECVVQALADTGEYEYVDKDFIFEHQFERVPPGHGGTVPPVTSVTVSPNDPLFDLQWHLKAQGTGDDQSPGGAGFAEYWAKASNQGSRDVVVAVVDTGLQMAHPDIANSPNIAPGFDMVSDERMANDGNGRDRNPDDPGDRCDPTNPLQRDSFHGTHVAGTIGAATTNNGAGVAGAAWNVSIVPVRALGRCGGRLSDINDAIRWAAGTIGAIDENGDLVVNENPADIINLSIGLFEPCPASMQDAIDEAVQRGSIVVTAAGNARVNARFYAPGGCRNVISVAAGDALGQIAPYSNYGDVVDILAPGGDMLADANNDGLPDGVLSTKYTTDCYDPVTRTNVGECQYNFEQGTSMAAPHVSAALALILAQKRAESSAEPLPSEVTDALYASLSPRSKAQCGSSCSAYPGTPEIEGAPGLCYRACGEGLLNLANATP